jgi:hypothetical protein
MTQVIINDVPPYTQGVAILGQTVFGTNWTANYESDVVVYKTPFGQEADDAADILSYPSTYTVTFVGDQRQVQVELVTPCAAGDRVTITRQTPADRENLYTNTNFLPSMLNNDFGILTLVDQQAQLVNQLIGPRYNYSSVIVPVVDTILPILGANQGWVKNPNDDAIIVYDFPASGIAPAGDTYITMTDESATLPNSTALVNVGSGILVSKVSGNQLLARSITGTANQITVLNGDGLSANPNIAIAQNPIMPGTAGMGIPQGTTAQRAIPSSGISMRYNTTTSLIEYWSGTTWESLVPTGLTLLHNYIYVGNALNQAIGVPVSKDVTVIDTGAMTVVSIDGVPIDLAGSFTTVGAFDVIQRYTANTDVTFPVSGTLATTGDLPTPAALTRVDDTNVTLTLGGSPSTALLAATSLTLGWTGQLGISRGGTGVGAVTTSPTASAWAGWDANENMRANNFLFDQDIIATAAGTTTLTVASSYMQYFTGTTTQTVVLPDVTTLRLGQTWYITNDSTDVVTVETSGGNVIQAMSPESSMLITCVALTGTGVSSWYSNYPLNGSTGNVNPGLANEIAYYAANGIAVSGLTTTNSSVLTSTDAGVLAWVAGATAGYVLTYNGSNWTAAESQGGGLEQSMLLMGG